MVCPYFAKTSKKKRFVVVSPIVNKFFINTFKYSKFKIKSVLSILNSFQIFLRLRGVIFMLILLVIKKLRFFVVKSTFVKLIGRVGIT